ncbi:MAG: Holliday junction resolvase RuvX [Abditibacteriales bacterium]|nr:Holliday junction resolvase RuvX [Abditibacteriales bacterium]MDW8366876.1 Holliday junction resolvase RuvX [Abditibacteriales bacterium]
MRILALDIGDVRIGVAVSDPLGMLASPHSVIERTSLQNDCERVRQLVEQLTAGEIVVGWPLRTDNQESAAAKKVEAFAQALRQVVNVPVRLVDERFSTKIADDAMKAAGRSSKKRRHTLDAAAAAVILQGYLDGQMKRRSFEIPKSKGDGQCITAASDPLAD